MAGRGRPKKNAAKEPIVAPAEGDLNAVMNIDAMERDLGGSPAPEQIKKVKIEEEIIYQKPQPSKNSPMPPAKQAASTGAAKAQPPAQMQQPATKPQQQVQPPKAPGVPYDNTQPNTQPNSKTPEQARIDALKEFVLRAPYYSVGKIIPIKYQGEWYLVMCDLRGNMFHLYNINEVNLGAFKAQLNKG